MGLNIFAGGERQLCGGHYRRKEADDTNFYWNLSSPDPDAFAYYGNIDCLWTISGENSVALVMLYEYLSQTGNCSQGKVQVR